MNGLMKTTPCIVVCLLILTASGLSVDVEDIEDLIKRQGIAVGDGVCYPNREIQKIGAPAIPYLLPLLKDKQKGVRNAAGAVLRDIDGLNETHLDDLIAAYHRGVDNLAMPIARIGTPKAVDALMKELLRKRRYHVQTVAIKALGAKVIPSLLALYRKKSGWDEDLEKTMDHVFGSLGSKAVTAIPELLEIAANKKTPALSH